MRDILVTMIGLLVWAGAYSQTIPVNPSFGKVSDLEVSMKVYEPDTTASAVLLYGMQEVEIGISPQGNFARTRRVHQRWKILKDEGKRNVDYEIIYNVDENVNSIRAVTYNAGADGEVVRTKMSRQYVFDDKYSDNYRRTTFAPENVAIGSVVEVTYTVVSKTASINDIFIQQESPVNRMDVIVSYPTYFTYNRMMRGYERCSSTSSSEALESFNLGGRTYDYKKHIDSYTATNLPPIKKEPYAYCPRQYALSLVYDIRQVWFPWSSPESLSNNWTDVDRYYRESGLMSGIKGRFPAAKELSPVLEGKASPAEVISAVRNFVCSRVEWDEYRSIIPKDVHNVWRQGKGSSAEINVLVAQAINSLDSYCAEPVLIKDRRNGFLFDHHIGISEFDTFILRITAPDGSVWYLDPVLKDAYLNVISPKYIVTQGRLLHLDGEAEWVDLTGELPSSAESAFAKLSLNADGKLSGNVKVKYTNNISQEIKSDYHSFASEEEWIEDTENEIGLSIEEMSISGADDYTNSVSVDFTLEGEDLNSSGNMVYLKPVIAPFHSESAFKDEQRNTPVEFPYRETLTYVCAIDIGDGYEVSEMPQQIILNAPGLGKSYIMMQFKQTGNVIMVNYKYSLSNMIVPAENYQELRLFWEQACVAEKSMITLVKK
ncbi:MAG: DUF3857 domain-containing protein [Bacteroidales bacterium]|nr:DUF3857 domain-containing protein [Bacteroidales bacterium]